jgi:signal transduction histidine kinase
MKTDEPTRGPDGLTQSSAPLLAHELRTPLGCALNALTVLNQAGAGEGAKEAARGLIERQLRHARQLVENLLDLARLESGKARPRRQRLDLAAWCRAAVGDLRCLADAGGLLLSFDGPDEPVWVTADEVCLVQILNNLVGNALKFTERGGRVTVEVARERASAVAFLTVRDTGAGIERDMLAKVFDPFIQAPQTLSRNAGGLGLGLTLVKALVTLLGGTVEAHSEGPGRGTELKVRLPCEPAEAPDLALEGARRICLFSWRNLAQLSVS